MKHNLQCAFQTDKRDLHRLLLGSLFTAFLRLHLESGAHGVAHPFLPSTRYRNCSHYSAFNPKPLNFRIAKEINGVALRHPSLPQSLSSFPSVARKGSEISRCIRKIAKSYPGSIPGRAENDKEERKRERVVYRF